MRREVLVLVGVVMLVSVACSDDDSAPVTTVVAPSTTAAPTTTTTRPPATTTTTTTIAATTTATVASDTVGDPEALAALVEDVTDQVRIVYDDESIALAPPDLTNPDPVVVLAELNGFGELVAAVVPFRMWSSVTTFPGSPSEDIAIENADELLFDGMVRLRPDGPLEYVSVDIVDIASLDLPSETTEGMPADAVALLYVSNSGPLVLVDRETGALVRELSSGWTDRSILGILVPTDSGWREWDTILDFQGTI